MAYMNGCGGGCLGDFDWGRFIEQAGNTASQVITSARTMPRYDPGGYPVGGGPSERSGYIPPAPIYSTASVMPASYSQPAAAMNWLPWLIGAGLVAGLVFKGKR